MEPFLSSDLMNDSLLDYWHTDHNPLISTSVNYTHLTSPPTLSHVHSTGDEHSLESECHTQITDVNEDVGSLFIDQWKKESHIENEVELTDNNSPPSFFGNEEVEGQNLNTPVSTDHNTVDEIRFLSPSKANGTGLFDTLVKDSDKYLDSDIITTCDLYSPLKENTVFKSEKPETLIFASNIGENQRAPDNFSTISDSDCQDIWQAVDFVESGIQTPANASQQTRQSERTESKTAVHNTHYSVIKNTLYSLQDKIQPKGLTQTNNHHLESLTPLGWLHHSAQYPVKNHVRFKKSRTRKPYSRNFQSSFFRLPLQAKNKSPQLQMVKLFRSTMNRTDKDSPVQEKTVLDIDKITAPMLKSPDDSLPEDNPELALMKTVDMPSGKRVEDIYVVPSVWITGEESDGSNAANSQPECDPSSYSHNPGFIIGPLGDDSPCQGLHYQNNPLDTFQNQNFSSQVMISSTLNSSFNMNSNGTTSSSHAEVSWPEVDSNCGMKNLIITTLNAPKIDMVPCLKDLCKAVLNDQVPSLEEQAIQSKSLSAMDAKQKWLYSESSVCNSSPSCQHVYQIKDDMDQTAESMHCHDSLENQTKGIVVLQMDKENLPPEHGVVMDDSLSFEEISPRYNSFNLSTPARQYKTKIEPVDCPEEGREESDISLFNFNYKDNSFQSNVPATSANIPRDKSLLGGVGTMNQETVSNISVFSTSTLPLMSASTSCESMHSNYDNTNEGTITHTASSLPEASSSSSFIDSPFNGEMDEDEPYNLPELVTLMRKIKELHVNDPVNKPLANLSTTLHLLHDAEKTLLNANFGVYQQLKMGHHSKFGQLIRCILSLANTIVLMGKTLYEWTRYSTDHQCLKTVEVLTNLYHTNIINLIELITPYFHYVCSLIASCHSDILRLNKTMASTEANRDTKIGQSCNKVCRQSMSDNILTEKTSSSYVKATPNYTSNLQVLYDLDKNSVMNVNQNNPVNIQSEYEFAKTCANPPQLSHKRNPTQSKVSIIREKKQKVSLLTNKLSAACKNSPYMRAAEAKLAPDEVRYSIFKTDASKTKSVLINLTNNSANTATRSSTPSQTNIKQPILSQNKAFYQSRSAISSWRYQSPSMFSFRAPGQLGNRDIQRFSRPRNSEVRVHDFNSVTTGGVISGNKASEQHEPLSSNRSI